ncbi:MAG: hypothetical protein KF795_10805 [Labilithrix sp.]|nr:hypothetical protein [Labilithrix sp.]
MTARSVVVGFVVALSSLVGCGALPDEDAADGFAEDDDGAVTSATSALSPRDDVPAPFDVPVPALPSFNRPIWDLQPFLRQLQERRNFGGCYQYYVTILNPAGGEPTKVPVTVCN